MLQQNYSSAMANMEASACETDPLLHAQRRDPNPIDNDGGPAPAVEVRESSLVNLVTWLFNFVFYFFCFLSGQYYIKTDTSTKDSVRSTWKTKARVGLSCLGLLMFFLLFWLCICHIVFSIWMEVDRIKKITEVMKITVNVDTSTPNESHTIAKNISISQNCSLPHENWKIPTAMTISTAASSISFLLMTLLILIPVYSYIRKCKCIRKCICSCCKDSKILCRVCCNSLCKVLKKDAVISPFEDNKNTSTVLTSDQSLCFYCNYFIALLLLGVCFVSLYFGACEYRMHWCLTNEVHLISFVFRLVSQFCTIHSCFIFSKIVYIVTGQLDQILKNMDKVNDERNKLLNKPELQCYFNVENEPVDIKKLLQSPGKANQERGCYYLLRNIDGKFIDCVKPILDLFGYWFILHWVLYGLSTVLLSASVVELVVDVFKPSPMDKVVPIEDKDLKKVYIVYVVFYTLEHAYLFVYPCFRAASIAAAREKLIFDVSKRYWEHIPFEIEGKFLQYLGIQNFSFKAPILCANVSFGFNWAFVSLFIAVCGGFIKF